jgi:uncharacterized membrane protein
MEQTTRLRGGPAAAISLAAVAAAGLCAAAGFGLPPRAALLAGWCAGTATHATLTVRHLLRASPEAFRRDGAPLRDGNGGLILGASVAALAALAGVAWEIGGGQRAAYSLPLGVLTIALSWVFIHVGFAREYAHAFWRTGDGFAFPGAEQPDGAEFLYLAFTVGMTCAVSDVGTTAPRMRRLVLMHALAAFAFNAAIVGAAVNILA